jgi:dTDP-6-deoxy-L-talose 4-dehydrogenase (NAD+)
VKVLVTGATGFIGSHVVPHLLERGHSVVALGRDASVARKREWYSDVRFVEYDIHSHLTVPRLDVLGSPEVLIHLAWQGLPNYKELFHIEQNLPADYRFIKALVEDGLPRVLITGTCAEYGLQNGCLYEELPCFPAHPYALAKDTLRKFLCSLKRQYEFTIQWLRLFYVFGDGQGGGSLLSQLDDAIARGDKYFNMSGGEQLRDYISVADVAQRIVMLAEARSCDGIYNCCSGRPVSVRAIVEQRISCRGAKIELRLGYYPYLDYEPMAFWGDVRKFEREVGKPR